MPRATAPTLIEVLLQSLPLSRHGYSKGTPRNAQKHCQPCALPRKTIVNSTTPHKQTIPCHMLQRDSVHRGGNAKQPKEQGGRICDYNRVTPCKECHIMVISTWSILQLQWCGGVVQSCPISTLKPHIPQFNERDIDRCNI